METKEKMGFLVYPCTDLNFTILIILREGTETYSVGDREKCMLQISLKVKLCS